MFLSKAMNSSLMPPRKDKELLPHFEKRRIVGSLRERTVYVQSPSNSQSYQYDDKIAESRKSALVDQLLNDLAKRINDHVERELSVQQISIDQKIDEIDEHTRSNLMIQETLENRLKKLKKKLRQKNHSHSQPIPTCRSAITVYKCSQSHFTSDSDNDSESDSMKSSQQIYSLKYTDDQDHNDNCFFTTLW